MRILVDFACNNPDNGDFLGKCERIELPHCAMELEGSEHQIIFGERAIKFGRKMFNCRGYKRWVGNWCWDGTWMEPADAVKLLAYLKELGWRCTAGWCDLIDPWERGDLTAELLSRELESEVKP